MARCTCSDVQLRHVGCDCDATRAGTMINTGIEQPSVTNETDKAICVAVRNERVWLPKSQIQWKAVGCFHPTIHVPLWLARKNRI